MDVFLGHRPAPTLQVTLHLDTRWGVPTQYFRTSHAWIAGWLKERDCLEPGAGKVAERGVEMCDRVER